MVPWLETILHGQEDEVGVDNIAYQPTEPKSCKDCGLSSSKDTTDAFVSRCSCNPEEDQTVGTSFDPLAGDKQKGENDVKISEHIPTTTDEQGNAEKWVDSLEGEHDTQHCKHEGENTMTFTCTDRQKSFSDSQLCSRCVVGWSNINDRIINHPDVVVYRLKTTQELTYVVSYTRSRDIFKAKHNNGLPNVRYFFLN